MGDPNMFTNADMEEIMSFRMKSAVVPLALLCFGGSTMLTACGDGESGSHIAKSDIERKLTKDIAFSGLKAVTCEHGLEDHQGAKTECLSHSKSGKDVKIYAYYTGHFDNKDTFGYSIGTLPKDYAQRKATDTPLGH